MNFQIGSCLLRRPEESDVESLYAQKNDPATAQLLGGFSTGYSREDIRRWIEAHRARKDEVLWAIECEGRCIGHVGLYQIDFRIRSAEFAIMLGDPAARGKGIGRDYSAFAVAYAFDQLNLNRVSLQVLKSNERARRLYASLGFVEEGLLREAQFKSGAYDDVVIMSILRRERGAPGGG